MLLVRYCNDNQRLVSKNSPIFPTDVKSESLLPFDRCERCATDVIIKNRCQLNLINTKLISLAPFARRSSKSSASFSPFSSPRFVQASFASYKLTPPINITSDHAMITEIIYLRYSNHDLRRYTVTFPETNTLSSCKQNQ
jgi:hypothetical protein